MDPTRILPPSKSKTNDPTCSGIAMRVPLLANCIPTVTLINAIIKRVDPSKSELLGTSLFHKQRISGVKKIELRVSDSLNFSEVCPFKVAFGKIPTGMLKTRSEAKATLETLRPQPN